MLPGLTDDISFSQVETIQMGHGFFRIVRVLVYLEKVEM